MSVLSGNGGGPWQGEPWSGKFDVPWLCPDGAMCAGPACDGPGCLRVQRGSPEQDAYPEEPPGRWPADVIARYGERAGGRDQEQ